MTSVAGIWSIEFTGPTGGSGAAVVVLRDNYLIGGDSGYYFSGPYKNTDSTFHASVVVKHHTGPMTSVFGPISQFDLILEGAVGDKFIMGQGYIPNQPSMRMSCKLKKLDELPKG